MSTATVNGVDLCFDVTGTGPRLVLTHGSWTDGAGWAPSVARLAERFEVVIWDRRGHSRSQDGPGPGSRAQDAADLVGLIEHLGAEPVHLVGNSYGAIITLTVVGERPDLCSSAAVHEPPAYGLLEGSDDPALSAALASTAPDLAKVATLIESGQFRAAAEHFMDNVALGPGTWERLPEEFRSAVTANAPTFLDEMHDETALRLDAAALAGTTVPLLLTYGTASPVLFPAVITELARLVPAARVRTISGAGHIPHATHPEQWTDCLIAFQHELRAGRATGD